MKFIIIIAISAILINQAQAQSPAAEEYFKRGVARYQQGDFEGAIKDYDRAIAAHTGVNSKPDTIKILEPGTASIYYNRGVARFDLMDWDGAIADLNEAITLNPRFVMAYIKRGNTRMNKAEGDEAVADFTQALRLVPDSDYYRLLSEN